MSQLLHHERRGSGGGRPLLLLRPLAGTIGLWGPFLTALAAERVVVACEPRGIPPSPPLRPITTTRTMARDVAALVDALGIAPVHVFGLSLGGMVATRLAAERPELIASLALGSTPVRGVAVGHAPARAIGFTRCIARGEDQRTACLTRRVLSPRFVDREPARVAAIVAEAGREPTPLATLVAHAVAGGLHDASPDLARIRAPALCIAGRQDRLVGVDAVTELARRLHPPAEVTVLDAGHDLSLERPAELAACVARFAGSHDR